MPKPTTINQPGLFGESADDVARHTRKSADEKAWDRERKRRSKKSPMGKMPATAPCCGRCRNWRPSYQADDRYGTCAIRVVTIARVAPYVEQNICLERDPDGRLMLGPGTPLKVFVPTEPQRCGPAYLCRSYVATVEEAVAA